MSNVVIYSKRQCTFCTQAKELLARKNVPFVENVLDVDFSREYIVGMFPHARSYPIIVIDDVIIGGFEQLKEHLSQHDNRKLLVE